MWLIKNFIFWGKTCGFTAIICTLTVFAGVCFGSSLADAVEAAKRNPLINNAVSVLNMLNLASAASWVLSDFSGLYPEVRTWIHAFSLTESDDSSREVMRHNFQIPRGGVFRYMDVQGSMRIPESEYFA